MEPSISRYKAVSFAASLTLRPDSEAGRQGLGEGANRRPKGALRETAGGSVAPFRFLADMGQRRRPKRLAERLLQIREALSLSQKEMAERLGVTRGHVSKYERGKTAPPLEVVLAYARAGNVQMEQIIDDDLDLNL